MRQILLIAPHIILPIIITFGLIYKRIKRTRDAYFLLGFFFFIYPFFHLTMYNSKPNDTNCGTMDTFVLFFSWFICLPLTLIAQAIIIWILQKFQIIKSDNTTS